MRKKVFSSQIIFLHIRRVNTESQQETDTWLLQENRLSMVARRNQWSLTLFARHIRETQSSGLQIPENRWYLLFLWSSMSQRTILEDAYFAESLLWERTKRTQIYRQSGLHFAIRPVPHSDDLRIPVFHDNSLKLVGKDESDIDINERHSENYPDYFPDTLL